MAARRAENRLQGKFVLLHASQVAELTWWLEQLADPTLHCLPMASRVVFPDFSFQGLVMLLGRGAGARLAAPERLRRVDHHRHGLLLRRRPVRGVGAQVLLDQRARARR